MDATRCLVLICTLVQLFEVFLCHPHQIENGEKDKSGNEKGDELLNSIEALKYFDKRDKHVEKREISDKIDSQLNRKIDKGQQIIQLTDADKLDAKHVDSEDPIATLIGSMTDVENGVDLEATNVDPQRQKGQFNQDVGEMVLTEQQKKFFESSDSEGELSRQKRNVNKFAKLWPKKIIPYEIDKSSLLNFESYEVIAKAVSTISTLTCVKWERRSTELAAQVGHANYVRFYSGSGCLSEVGYMETQPQDISLKEGSVNGSSCLSPATVLHEMMHAMGFAHEQNRFDRDEYLTINWENVKETEIEQFKKTLTDDSVPYDVESLMQYSLTDFSKNGKQTMSLKDKNLEFLVDSRSSPSFYDVQELTNAYGCTDHCRNSRTCLYGGFVNKDCVCSCPTGLIGSRCETLVTDPDCGGIIEIKELGHEITIQSPNYPDAYPTGKICRWLIKVPGTLYIRLTIGDLQLTSSYTKACLHWLEVQYNLPGQTGRRLCGDIASQTITTSKDSRNLMILTFDSKFSKNRIASKGFSLSVSAVGPGCKNDPCINGRCEDEELSCNFTCVCEPGYKGRLCDTIDENGILTCSFETNEHCFLKNTPTSDNFDWGTTSGVTRTEGTGPTHAFKGNRYMFAEMLGSRQPGDTADLVSSVDLKVRNRCLKFQYHMFGRNIGALNVYIKGKFATKSKVWNRKGNQGFDWLEAEVNIPATLGLKIIIEAVRGDGIYGDIALDDIRLIPGACKNSPKECLITAKGSEYKGKMNVTLSGSTCTPWAIHKGYENKTADSNYCRNPDSESMPWCYIADDDWSICDIPQCNPEECRRSSNGYEYRGTVSVTESGIPCQRWDSQTPHKHEFARLSGHENYCRNPDGDKRPWCVTMDKDINIDYCDIPLCETPAEQCMKTSIGFDYFGNVSVTTSGKTCQRWDSQTPHSHPYSSLADQENFCRNPNIGNDDQPWCYTNDTNVEREYCDIKLCEDDPCYPNPCKNGGKCSVTNKVYKCQCFFGFVGKNCESIDNTTSGPEECRRTKLGIDYNGTISTTRTNRKCQRWGDQKPHKHQLTSMSDQENYCRNPDRDEYGLWCFTTDPYRKYDYCDVPMCSTPAKECRTVIDGVGHYYGKVNFTKDGYQCARWDSPASNSSGFSFISDQDNYCRSPDGDPNPWCFTTNPEVLWQNCAIPEC